MDTNKPLDSSIIPALKQQVESYVDGKIGEIDSALSTLVSGVGV